MTTLVFDMDYLKYSFAAACEKRFIDVTRKSTGEVKRFKTRTEFYGRSPKKAGGYLAELNKGRESPLTEDDFTIIDVQEAEPISFALQSIKNHIYNVCEQLGADTYYGYIGRGDSWRVEASTILRYKGTRSTLLKPLLLPEIEEYLIKHHDAQVCTHYESDDMCVMDATEDKSKILVVVEKDFNSSQVTIFNPYKMTKPLVIKGLGELYLDDKGKVRGHGRKHLAFQVLSGDSSDNFFANSASDVRWGDKSAYNLLKDCQTDKQVFEALVKGYRHLYPEPKTIKGWRGDEITVDAMYVCQENLTMAHLLRHKTDRIVLEDVLEKLGVEH